MLAPPWISVPPPGYGGRGVGRQRAHRGARPARPRRDAVLRARARVSSATVVTLLDAPHPDEIERSLYEVDHVARAFDDDRAGRPLTAASTSSTTTAASPPLAMADRIDTPLVHTLHGQFTPEHRGLLRAPRRTRRRWWGSAARSSRRRRPSWPDRRRSPTRSTCSGVAAAGAQGRLPAVDRTDDPGEGPAARDRRRPRRGCAAGPCRRHPARAAGVLRPRDRAALDGERVRFVGEVGGAAKRSLFAGARALLMPIRWEEPFGMVMVEALACGTPVIAFPEGAARELVVDGQTGFLVDDERAMAAAVGRLDADRARDCRAWVRRALRRRRGRRRLRADVPVGRRAPAAAGARACLSGP